MCARVAPVDSRLPTGLKSATEVMPKSCSSHWRPLNAAAATITSGQGQQLKRNDDV